MKMEPLDVLVKREWANTTLRSLTVAIMTGTTLAWMIEHETELDDAWRGSADANEMRLLLVTSGMHVPKECPDCVVNGLYFSCGACADLIRAAVPKLPIEMILDAQARG